jgi:glycosyltransferase involved in cell wall biosynthesis
MRVLMTLDAVGGVWRYAVELAAGLRAAGTSTVFLGFGPPPSERQRREAGAAGTLDWADAPLDWLVADEGALAPVPRAIEDAARRHRADLLHLNLPSQAACLGVAVPVVAVSHSCVATWFRAVRGTALPSDWAWQGRLTGQGLRGASVAVAPSRSHAAALVAAYGPLPNLRVVHNGSAPREARPGEGSFAVASGRWWDEGKGASTLDAAAEHAKWPVRMLGALQGSNGQSFLPRHAAWAGELPHGDAVDLMGRAGAFVSPSLYEPFGLAVAEAAGLGRPLVLSDIPTFRELWDDAALFFPPRDAWALARHLDALAADPVLRAQLGARARARAARFAPEAQASRMLAIYADLLGAAPLRAAG